VSVEQLQKYKQIGESMYNNVDFSNSTILTNLLAESLSYVRSGLQSGLHPKDLNENELALLEQGYGKEWYIQFEYTIDDLPEKIEQKELKPETGHF
jgi:hypothetical protein